MENKIKKRNFVLIIICILLLICSWFIYSDVYKEFFNTKSETITVGVFSDSYWEVQNGYSYQILEDAIQIFKEKYPNINVEYISGILKEDYSEWLSEKILSGTAPDLFFILGEDFNDFAEIGVLKDLTPLIESDKELQKDAFYSSALAYGQYHNIQYALPYECAPKLMFVNKSILNQEGLEIPNNKWTWEEFYEICKVVTKDTDGNGILDQFGVVGYTWEEAFESNGITVFNQDGTECYLTGDSVGEALSFIEKLQDLNKGYNTTNRDFDLGNVVFQPMSFSEFRAYKPYPLSVKKYFGFEWGCIPMPAGPRGNNVSTLDTLLIAMNKKTKNMQYAWEFMKVLTYNTQIQSEIFDFSEGVSVLKEVTESDQTLQRLMESAGETQSMDLLTLSDAVENAVVSPKFRNLDEAKIEVGRAVEEIIGGSNISMEQIIWNRKINKYLKDNQ